MKVVLILHLIGDMTEFLLMNQGELIEIIKPEMEEVTTEMMTEAGGNQEATHLINLGKKGQDLIDQEKKDQDLIDQGKKGQDLIDQEEKGQDLIDQEEKGQDLIDQERIGQDLIDQERIGQDLKDQEMIDQDKIEILENLEKEAPKVN